MVASSPRAREAADRGGRGSPGRPFPSGFGLLLTHPAACFSTQEAHRPGWAPPSHPSGLASVSPPCSEGQRGIVTVAPDIDHLTQCPDFKDEIQSEEATWAMPYTTH